MRKITTPTATLLLLSLNCQANNRVEMQIHFFEKDAEPAINEASPPVDQPKMKMMIYNNDLPANDSNKRQHKNNHQIYNKDEQHNKDQPFAVYSDQQQLIQENEEDIQIEFYASTGYRHDKLDWTIAAPSGTPNILSELTWDNLEIAVIEVGMSMHTASNWVVDARLSYGTILDGKNQDSDYLGNNRTQEFSRSNNNADEGNTLDVNVGFGYQLDIIPSGYYAKPWLSITPKVGASFNAQNLKILNGFQTIPATGNFGGLDSSYDASWYGPWVGFDTELSIADQFSISTSFEYHYAFYEATANWNLRTDLAKPISFEHEAEGVGYVASIGSEYRITPDFFINLSVNYQKWKADRKGIDTVFTSAGNVLETKFNEVNWESMGANIGLSYRF